MISVLTIVNGREAALANFMNGLALSTILPDELIIVFMNEPVKTLSAMPFPVHCYSLNTEAKLPLAAARNMAAAMASGDFFIFLDVDCIPAANMLAQYMTHQNDQALLSGAVRYLKKGATAMRNYLSQLNELSKPDPIRSELHQIPYTLFWSLNFACTKAVYFKIGGFSEDYKGYGAEDTDFSFTAEKKSVPVFTIDAVAYHQYHDSYTPPLNHLQDIVANANLFYQKWQRWPMEGWLAEFSSRGFIEWQKSSVILLKLPSNAEIRKALKVDQQ